MPWIPHKYTDGSIEWEHIDELPVSCPYCGHSWKYSGEDPHYATCSGTDTIKNYPEYGESYLRDLGLVHKGQEFKQEEWTWKCHKRVRLHPRLIKTRKKIVNKINFPNKNYEPIEVETR